MNIETIDYKLIPKHPEYGATRDGRILSISHNWRGYGIRELSQSSNSNGYPSVRLVVNGKRKRLAVHKLVALTYLGNKPTEKCEIRHLDGDKGNNRIDNLVWGTPKENAQDRERHGNTSRGIRHSDAIKKALIERRGFNAKW